MKNDTVKKHIGANMLTLTKTVSNTILDNLVNKVDDKYDEVLESQNYDLDYIKNALYDVNYKDITNIMHFDETFKRKDDTYYLYVIQKDTITPKYYIGVTNNPRRRYREHCTRGAKGIGKAIEKYGANKYIFTILFSSSDEKLILLIERYLSIKMRYEGIPLYNSVTGRWWKNDMLRLREKK